MNIYHRIFKLNQRKVPLHQIAATTNMPLSSVKEILRRLENSGSVESEIFDPSEGEPYLDYIVTRTNKYAIIDFSGFFTQEFSEVIKQALLEVPQQMALSLAIKMDELVKIDEAAFSIILSNNTERKASGKELLILSPSDSVEKFIGDHHIESQMKIFGTLSAFEAFTMRSATSR